MLNDRQNCLLLNKKDTVLVALHQLVAGEILDSFNLAVRSNIPSGHKVAVVPMKEGDEVRKYGQVIGYATADINPGEHVHCNIDVRPTSKDYAPGSRTVPTVFLPENSRRSFDGYVRGDGRVGTRNYLGIIASVSCAGDVSQFIADEIYEKLLPDFPSMDGVVALSHGGGCCHAPGSGGLELLQRTLTGYSKNPNFGGVIFLGLGCEVNQVETLMASAGLQEHDFLRTIAIQNAGGTSATIKSGLEAAGKMLPAVSTCRRTAVSAEHLVLGLECGGSDAYSGITANPALGAAVDLLVENGGTAILSETPEIYGAEHLLIRRAAEPEVAEKLSECIHWWEHYTALHGAQINNNPTPGNKAGGISTILEKSLGAVAKAGSTNLNGVYRYAEQVTGRGLVFMDTPGYDVVSITGMIAGGANLVCFTTGRGTVCGFKPVPTIKIATSSEMYHHLEEDMDINCGPVLDQGLSIRDMGELIFEEILRTASGKQTKSERFGFGGSGFVPWPMGVVL